MIRLISFELGKQSSYTRRRTLIMLGLERRIRILYCLLTPRMLRLISLWQYIRRNINLCLSKLILLSSTRATRFEVESLVHLGKLLNYTSDILLTAVVAFLVKITLNLTHFQTIITVPFERFQLPSFLLEKRRYNINTIPIYCRCHLSCKRGLFKSLIIFRNGFTYI